MSGWSDEGPAQEGDLAESVERLITGILLSTPMPVFAFLISAVDPDRGRAALEAGGALVEAATASDTLPFGGAGVTPAATLAGSIEAETEEGARERLERALPENGFELLDLHRED